MSTLSCKDIVKDYPGTRALDHVSASFESGKINALLGKNGSGKSTLCKIFAGAEQATSGEFYLDGQALHFKSPADAAKDGIVLVYQETSLVPSLTVTENIFLGRLPKKKNGAVDWKTARARTAELMQGMNLRIDPRSKVMHLPMWQRQVVEICKALSNDPKVLILDEPTNDLDIETLTILEDYLDSFPGIVIMVSHDRYFLDRCARRIFAFEENGQIRQYEGGYTDYRDRVQMKKEGKAAGGSSTSDGNEDAAGKSESGKSWKKPSTKLKFSYKEQREYETIEDDIAALEEKIETLEAGILKAATDFVKLNELTKEKEETEKLLEEKMDRWEYLEDLKARIDAQ